MTKHFLSSIIARTISALSVATDRGAYAAARAAAVVANKADEAHLKAEVRLHTIAYDAATEKAAAIDAEIGAIAQALRRAQQDAEWKKHILACKLDSADERAASKGVWGVVARTEDLA